MQCLRVVLHAAILAALLGGCVEANPPAVQHGTVIGVSPANMPAENTGAGGVAGAVGGGLVGAQFGSGLGKALVVAGGVVAGAVAGTAVETAVQNASGLKYVVRLDSGAVLTIVQHRWAADPVLPVGAPVLVATQGWQQRVTPAPLLR